MNSGFEGEFLVVANASLKRYLSSSKKNTKHNRLNANIYREEGRTALSGGGEFDHIDPTPNPSPL